MKCDRCQKDLTIGDEHLFGSLYFSSKESDKKAVNAGGGLKVHLCKECYEDLVRRFNNA